MAVPDALHGEFGFERPAALAGGGAEQVEEGLADSGFAGDVVPIELGQSGVIGLDQLVSWLEAGLLHTRHGGVLPEGERLRQRNDGADGAIWPEDGRMQNSRKSGHSAFCVLHFSSPEATPKPP